MKQKKKSNAYWGAMLGPGASHISLCCRQNSAKHSSQQSQNHASLSRTNHDCVPFFRLPATPNKVYIV
jgi:hypothetical protein